MPLGGLVTAGAINAGAGIFSSIFGNSAAKKAAQQQREAAMAAQNVNDRNTTNAQDFLKSNATQALGTVNTNTHQANKLFDPYATVGSTAASGLNTALANPFKFNMADDPGYQFRLQQGQKAVEQSAAARGGAMSGGALKELTQYGQGFASNEYQNAFARNQQQLQNLFQGAGLGMNAVGQQSSNLNQNSALGSSILGNASALDASVLGQNSALASQNLTGAGNAAAAGTVGGANAIIGGVNNLGTTANQMFLYNLLKGGSSGAGGAVSDASNGYYS